MNAANRNPVAATRVTDFRGYGSSALESELYKDFFKQEFGGMSGEDAKRILTTDIYRSSDQAIDQARVDQAKAIKTQFEEFQKSVDPAARTKRYAEMVSDMPGREATLLTGSNKGIGSLLGVPTQELKLL